MFRSTLVGIGSSLRYAILPIFDRDNDAVTITTPTTESRSEIAETGFERVRNIFRDK